MKPLNFDASSSRTSAKESYLLPQPEGVVRVQDYLFTEIQGTRCVLIRWVMEADFRVDSFAFELTELDVAENSLGTTAVTCGRADIGSAAKGTVFVPMEAVPVQEKCTAVKIRLTEVTSGNYVYGIKGTRVEPGYRAPERWTYDKRPGREDGLSDNRPLRVIRKRRSRVRFLWPVAVVTAILMLLMLLDPYVPRPPKEETSTGINVDGIGTGVAFYPIETGAFYAPIGGADGQEVTYVYEYRPMEPTEDVKP